MFLSFYRPFNVNIRYNDIYRFIFSNHCQKDVSRDIVSLSLYKWSHLFLRINNVACNFNATSIIHFRLRRKEEF